MNASAKDLHGLGGDCMSIHKTNKGKFVLLPFKNGPGPLVDDLFLDKYSVLELETDGKKYCSIQIRI